MDYLPTFFQMFTSDQGIGAWCDASFWFGWAAALAPVVGLAVGLYLAFLAVRKVIRVALTPLEGDELYDFAARDLGLPSRDDPSSAHLDDGEYNAMVAGEWQKARGLHGRLYGSDN